MIVGQDPGDPNHSCGVAFSYPKLPVDEKSLCATEQIFKELEHCKNINFQRPLTYDLSPWCQRGILLMNAHLTKPGDTNARHDKWIFVTEKIVQLIYKNDHGVVSVLWGEGRKLQEVIKKLEATRPKRKHLVLDDYHPCYRNQIEYSCNHFSRARAFQISNGIPLTDWSL